MLLRGIRSLPFFLTLQLSIVVDWYIRSQPTAAAGPLHLSRSQLTAAAGSLHHGRSVHCVWQVSTLHLAGPFTAAAGSLLLADQVTAEACPTLPYLSWDLTGLSSLPQQVLPLLCAAGFSNALILLSKGSRLNVAAFPVLYSVVIPLCFSPCHALDLILSH